MKFLKGIIILFLFISTCLPAAKAEEGIYIPHETADVLQRADDTRTLSPSKIKGDYKIWNLDLKTGLSIFSGNTEQISCTGDLKLNHSWDFASVYIWGKGSYLSINGKPTLNNLTGTVRGDYNIYGPLSWFIYNTHSTNEFIKLNYRMTIGSGPWIDFDLGPINNSSSLALAYEYQYYKPDIVENNARLSFRHIATYNILENLSVGFDFFYVPKVNDFSKYRIYFETFLENKIFDNVYLNVKLGNEIDSTPQPDIKPYDLSLITSLGFKFGE